MTHLPPGDPDALRRLGRRVDSAAQEVREEARRLQDGVLALPWAGPAADAFHRRLHGQVLGLLAIARRLDEVAAILARLAGAVAERREVLARAERALLGLLSGALPGPL